MLASALRFHRGALRASVISEYGVTLDGLLSMPARDAADLVVWLPAGCAFWRSFGGPASVSEEVRALQLVDYSVRVADYHARSGKGKKPKPPEVPPFAHERRADEARMERKAAAYLRRRGRR